MKYKIWIYVIIILLIIYLGLIFFKKESIDENKIGLKANFNSLRHNNSKSRPIYEDRVKVRFENKIINN